MMTIPRTANRYRRQPRPSKRHANPIVRQLPFVSSWVMMVMLVAIMMDLLSNRVAVVAAWATTTTAATSIPPRAQSAFIGSRSFTTITPALNPYFDRRRRRRSSFPSLPPFVTLTMGLQIKIRMVGREKSGTHDQWIQEACKMYTTRLQSSTVEIETEWHKTDAALVKSVTTSDLSTSNSQSGSSSSGGGAVVILLDPRGKMPTSEDFATDLYDWLEAGGSRVVFCIGGAEGLPPELKSGYVQVPKSGSKKGSSTATITKQLPMLSLSKLTFTHQFARLLLVEQIYRASEIRRGSNYHK